LPDVDSQSRDTLTGYPYASPRANHAGPMPASLTFTGASGLSGPKCWSVHRAHLRFFSDLSAPLHPSDLRRYRSAPTKVHSTIPSASSSLVEAAPFRSARPASRAAAGRPLRTSALRKTGVPTRQTPESPLPGEPLEDTHTNFKNSTKGTHQKGVPLKKGSQKNQKK
jgi:hypothetical protein